MTDASTPQLTTLEPWLRDLLRCPATGATLVDGFGPDGEPELVSTDPVNPLAYPIRAGIPVLLIDDARPVGPGGPPAAASAGTPGPA